MEILEGLNPEQRIAADHLNGPMLVVAGAGTGKTSVITRRVARLIGRGAAKPAQILALTFTDKAAREMQERLFELIGWESFQVPVMTFNSFGSELLARYAGHVGRSVRGGLLNDTQKALLLQQHLGNLQLKYYGPQTDMFEFLEGIVSYIGNLQNSGITATGYRDYVTSLRLEPGAMHPRDVDEQDDLAAFYEVYEGAKKSTGTFDYNDQLYLPLEILKARPNLAARLGREYTYVLVDEYQDTNHVQDELLRSFIPQDGNLFAVGDDDQAIYGFRGADIGNILAFADHFKLGTPSVLTQNYRSGQAILDAAYRLIQNNNPERLEVKLGIDKRLIAVHDDSDAHFRPYGTSAEERAGVLRSISTRLSQGTPAGDMAVLAATHAPLRALAKAMRQQGIPFALSTTVNIFEQPEVIGLWYLMKWLDWKSDEESLAHVLLGPYIGWELDDYRSVLKTSREQLISVEEAIQTSESDVCRELTTLLATWREWARELPVSQLAFQLVFETGVSDRWRTGELADGRLIRVYEDLQKWLEHMQDFETVAYDTTATGYFQTFPTPPGLEVAEPVGDADGIQLLTVHASKGLEFDYVYLIGCTQRAWSAGRSLRRQVPESLASQVVLPPEHEFRRLMYVALTRAKKTVEVSAPLRTPAGSKQAVSPLVSETFGATVAEPFAASEEESPMDRAVEALKRFYPMQGLKSDRVLPFENRDGWLEISVTALSRYDFCPFEFYVENVLQIKQPLGPQLAFGTALHRTFESYYRSRMSGYPLQAPELAGQLDEMWSNRGYVSRQAADDDHALAQLTLARFIDREDNLHRDIIGSEVPIRFELAEAKLRLNGKIDALFQTDEGVEIRDFKTGRTITDETKLADKAKKDLQLRSYACAYQELKGEAPSSVVLDYVVTQTEGRAHLSSAILRNHRDKLASLATKIRQWEFAPNPSPGHTCAAIKYYGTGEQDEMALGPSSGATS